MAIYHPGSKWKVPNKLPSLTSKQKAAMGLVQKKAPAKPKKKPAPMKLDELRVQIAIGTLKDPKAIAEVVKNCNDPKIVRWASRHQRATVRVEAAKKSCLPFGVAMKMVFLDKAKTVKTAAAHSLGKQHFDQLLLLLDSIEDFPQMALPFSESTNKIDYTIIDGPDEYNGEAVADAVQTARQSHEREQTASEVDIDEMEEERVDALETLEDIRLEMPF